MDLLDWAYCMNLTIVLNELNGWIFLQRAHMLWAQSCRKASDALVQGCNLAACILHAVLDADERRFLLSLVRAQPEWELLGIPHVSELPAVRWKLQNLARLQRERGGQFERQYTALASLLQQ
jgi:hypothetical protein